MDFGIGYCGRRSRSLISPSSSSEDDDPVSLESSRSLSSRPFANVGVDVAVPDWKKKECCWLLFVAIEGEAEPSPDWGMFF